MAMTPDDPLERATAAIRDEPSDTGWLEVSETVKRRVRGLVTPAASLVAHTDDGREAWAEDGSRVLVSERVLVPALRHAIDDEDHAVDDVRVRRDGQRLVGLEIDLVCTYGTDLAEQGRRVHDLATGTLRRVLGPDPDLVPTRDVVVAVVDVTAGDPRDD